MFTGLLFTTGAMKKDKLQVPQQKQMLSLYRTALGFISKNDKYKLENNMQTWKTSYSNNRKCV